jgi:hypothetical protein
MHDAWNDNKKWTSVYIILVFDWFRSDLEVEF